MKDFLPFTHSLKTFFRKFRKKKSRSPNIIVGVLVFTLLVVGVASATWLGSQGQDVRQRASVAYPQCGTMSESSCLGKSAGASCNTSGTCVNSETNANCICSTVPSPGSVNLTAPANGGYITDTTPTFTWQAATNAVKYKFELATSDNFGSSIIQTITQTGLTYTHTTSLTQGKVYYWRVSGINTINNQGPATTRSFILTTPQAPTLETPVNGSITSDFTPDFNWSDVPVASGYNFQLSTYSDFSQGMVANITVSPSYYAHTANLANNKTYYWRVRPKFGTLYGTFSPRFSFKTPNLPSVPTSLNPGSNLLITASNSRTGVILRPRLSWVTADTTSTLDPVAYDVQISKYSLFSSLVLEANNIPGLDSGGSSSTSYKRYWDVNQNLEYGTTYHWRVRSRSASGITSGWATSSFRLPLANPKLISPTTNSTSQTLRPTFDWDPVQGATGYNLYIRYNGGVETLLKSTTADVTSFTPTTDLKRNETNVGWSVTAKSSNYGNAVSISVFNTPNPPNVPTNGVSVVTNLVTLRWTTAFSSAIPKANGYDIQISLSSNFSNPIQKSVTGTLYSQTSTSETMTWNVPTTDLRAGTTHYWRVRAKRNCSSGSLTCQISAWSNTFSFRAP